MHVKTVALCGRYGTLRFSPLVFLRRHSGDFWSSEELLTLRPILWAEEALRNAHQSKHVSWIKALPLPWQRKEGRRMAGYRVVLFATATAVALCCVCEPAPFTHCWSIFVSMNAFRKWRERGFFFWLWQSVAFLRGWSAEPAAALFCQGFVGWCSVWLPTWLLTFSKGEKNVTFAEEVHNIESFYWLAFMGRT